MIVISSQSAKEVILRGTHLNQCDKPLSRQVITKKLIEVITYVDANKTIKGDENIISTVLMILEHCKTYNIEEIIRVLENLKMGVYGKFYERLQGPEILDAIRQYEENERCDIFEAHKNDEKQNINYDVMELPEFKKKFEKYEEDKKNEVLIDAINKASELIDKKTSNK